MATDLKGEQDALRPSGDEVWSLPPDDYSTTEWMRLLKGRARPRWTNFSWASPATLLDSLNDQVAKAVDRDLVNMRRMRWVATLRQERRASGDPDPGVEWVLDRTDLETFRFIVLGDPGEQDASQYAVVAPLLAKSLATDDQDAASFMVIMSDVIYPAGDVNDYVDGFYRPYEKFPGPVYAVPGNHDWYDGLEGFMYHFCGVEPLGVEKHLASSLTLRERIAQVMWRQSSRPERTWLYSHGVKRSTTPGREVLQRHNERMQPGPYYAIQTRHLTLVIIDTGINGTIDAEQGDWLQRVSSQVKGPKILLTGKPLVVDGHYHPCEINRTVKAMGTRASTEEEQVEEKQDMKEGAASFVDDIIRNPSHNYVATFGGDIHNYQRYRLRQKAPGARPHIDYVVAGGGGAYLATTHVIEPIDLGHSSAKRKPPRVIPKDVEPLKEKAHLDDDQKFICYPKRGDSLTMYTRLFGPLVAWIMLFNWAVVITLISATITGFPFGMGALKDNTVRTATVWQVLLGSIGMLVLLALIGAVTVTATRKVHWPYQGLTAFAVAGVFSSVAIGGIDLVFNDSWSWLWLVLVVTIGLVLLIVFTLLVARQLRGLAPTVVGDILVSAVAVGAITRAQWWRVDSFSGHAFMVAGAVAVSARSAWVLRRARLNASSGTTVQRVVALGVVATVIAFTAKVLHDSPVPGVALVCSIAIMIAIAGGVIYMTWPGVYVWPWLFVKMEPSEAFAEVAARMDLPNERPESATPRTRASKRRADLLIGPDGAPRRASTFVSELTEAATPPFFKQFLELQVSESEVLTRCWGVCGDAATQDSPSLEDEFTISLSA